MSCLVAKLSHFLQLTTDEKSLVEALEEEERHVTRGDTIWKQGGEAGNLNVVKSGWMYGYAVLPDGRKQVLDIYCPGDVLGMRDIVFDYSVSAVVAATDAVLCPFPKGAMDDVFVASPRLATLLYSLGMLENIVVIDRLRTLTQMDSRERLCHFLMQMRGRIGVTDPTVDDTFLLPLTQDIIASALGLSQVHLNRTIRQLEREGLISRKGKQITLNNLEHLRDICAYEDRHYRIDTTWFPHSS